jgi:hypothetical protein
LYRLFVESASNSSFIFVVAPLSVAYSCILSLALNLATQAFPPVEPIPVPFAPLTDVSFQTQSGMKHRLVEQKVQVLVLLVEKLGLLN